MSPDNRNRQEFTINVLGHDRTLFRLFEEGEYQFIVLRMGHSSRSDDRGLLTPTQSFEFRNVRYAQVRYMIHPTKRSLRYTSIKLKENMKDGREVGKEFNTQLTEAFRKPNLFCPIVHRRCPALVHDHYLTDFADADIEFTSLGSYDTRRTTLYFSIFGTSLETRVASGDFLSPKFRVMHLSNYQLVLCWWLRDDPSFSNGFFNKRYTLRPEKTEGGAKLANAQLMSGLDLIQANEELVWARDYMHKEYLHSVSKLPEYIRLRNELVRSDLERDQNGSP